MGKNRRGKVWSASSGWISLRETKGHDYRGYSDEWWQGWAFIAWVARWFPDKIADIFRSEESDFRYLEIIQRIMMRAFARYADVAITGTRGMTKTYTKFLTEMVNGIAWPGTFVAYFGPSYKQLAAIGAKTFHQLQTDYRCITEHWRISAESKDDFKVETDFGSSFYISAMRGDNLHAVTAEEFAQEEQPAFDFNEYTTIVLPAVRLTHNIKGEKDPNFVPYKNHSITSAGRKQNPAFLVRNEAIKGMKSGESAFAMDVPWQCVVLQQMRPYSWAMKLKNKLTPDRWLREMESRYTGASAYPVISDNTLAESQTLLVMERRHICKYPGFEKVDPKDVTYIVCYDVAYEANKINAKCALGVWKLTRQKSFFKRDRYLKQLVYMDDWPPPDNAMLQARRLKDVWNRFCFDGGNATYIAIDGRSYGKAVAEDLMKDLGDGLPPLCIKDHADYTSVELPGALPVIYPVRAGGMGATDNDFEMIKYAQSQWDNHNVEILTNNIRDGVEAYKKLHGIKDDDKDWRIAAPYQKCRELCGQVMNLKLVPSGAGMSERRISQSIQRDSWSAVKYGLRLAQILEREELVAQIHGNGDWSEALNAYSNEPLNMGHFTASRSSARRGIAEGRRGGRLF